MSNPDHNTAEDNITDTPAEEKLQKLYDQLPPIIALITEDNINQGTVAVKKLLGHFRKINDLEESLLPEGQMHTKLSLTRLYELAVNGGGADADELKQANAAFAEENTILVETIESLTFQIQSLKKKAADELILQGKSQMVPLADLRSALTDITGTMNAVEAQLSFLGSAPATDEANSAKPLDQRLAEQISTFDDISADLLKATPQTTSFAGRILRRAGFAYDYKDMAAVRQLVVAVLKANRTLAEAIETLKPAREQMEKLAQIIALLELHAGHEERQSTDYAEALKEIERLQTQLSRHQDAHSGLEEIEATLQKKNEALSALEEALVEKQKEYRELAATADITKLAMENKRLQKEKDSLQNTLEEKKKEICRLVDEKAQLQEKSMADLTILRGRMRAIKNGWLVEKLESEISSLRDTAASFEKKYEDEKEKRQAFEERVNIWVQKEETLTQERDTWRNRATLKLSFIAAAAGFTALGGYAGAAFMQGSLTGWLPAWYYGLCVAVPAGALAAWEMMDHGWDLGDVVKKGLKGAAAGLTIAGIGNVPIAIDHGMRYTQYANEAAETIKKEKQAFYNSITGHVVQILYDPETKQYSSVDLADRYSSQVITLDFTDRAKPKISADILQTPTNDADKKQQAQPTPTPSS